MGRLRKTRNALATFQLARDHSSGAQALRIHSSRRSSWSATTVFGTLLCVSDKPIHGEIKLPGVADKFYESAIASHLRIGLETITLLKTNRDMLHSRKLRAFDEPPFR